MRLIVAGGRDFNDHKLFSKWVSKIYIKHGEELIIVSGGAKGADTMGEQFAEMAQIPCHRYPAEWNRLGKAAGILRNHRMAENADALLAFWDGKSKGTKAMIEIAKNRGLPTKIIRYEN